MGNDHAAEPEDQEQFPTKLKALRINTKALSFSKPKSSKRRSTLLDTTPISDLSRSSPVTPYSTPRTSIIPITPKAMSTRRILSRRIIQLGLDFWSRQIDTLSMKQRLEIGCSIFMLTDAHTQKILTTHCNTANELESVGLKYLDMIGFTVRTVGTNAENVSVLLQQLGALHEAMQIDTQCYVTMLKQMDKVFGIYFPRAYTEAVKFALDEVFTYCAQLMTGADLKLLHVLDNVDFMHTLRSCIACDIGREYLFRYLHQVWCDEMVFFLQLVLKYKAETEDKSRLMIARDINKFCIKPKGVFVVNVSYQCRKKVMQQMSQCEFHGVMDKEMFADVENEMYSLIMQSHWFRFKVNILEMYLKE